MSTYPSEIPSNNMAKDKSKKSIKCNLCDSAIFVGNFGRHLKIHSGQKSHKCDQCDYASVHASNLRKHLKTHSGEKAYKCNQCNYASVEAGSLKKHIKSHSGKLLQLFMQAI